MSATYLPHRVAPLRLARDGVRMAGELPADRLPRFTDLVDAVLAPVRVALDFHLDEERRVCVSGSLAVPVTLTCQRCLGPVTLELASTLSLNLVSSEAQAASVPAKYDAVVVAREPVELAALLEDDLILAIPCVPGHAPGTCRMPEGPAEETAGEAQRENPFAALKKLKDQH